MMFGVMLPTLNYVLKIRLEKSTAEIVIYQTFSFYPVKLLAPNKSGQFTKKNGEQQFSTIFSSAGSCLLLCESLIPSVPQHFREFSCSGS